METHHGQGGKQPERKMELEVSKKIREAIKAKLLELGSHIDEELPDYVMILIANRRTVPQMETDLSLFLGDSAKKFVNWLTHVLKKLDRVTSVPGQKSEDDGPGTGSSSKGKAKKGSKSKKGGKDDDVTSDVKVVEKGPKKLTKHRKSKQDEVIEVTEVKSTVETSEVTSSTEDLSTSKRSSSKSVTESLKRLTSKTKSVEKIEHEEEITVNATVDDTAKENLVTSRFKLTMKQQTLSTKKPKKRSALDEENEDEDKSKPRLTLLSDDEPSPVKKSSISRADEEKAADSNHEEKITSKGVVLRRPKDSHGLKSQSRSDLPGDSDVGSQSEEPETHIDTLILNTEENEFADNVEELRRLALESQERNKRRDRGAHQKKLITGILMSNKDSFKGSSDKRVTRSSVQETRSLKSDHSPKRSTVSRRESKESSYSRPSKRESPDRIVLSPRKSVFDRLSKNSSRQVSRDTELRSRSRSPVRKLTSTIGNVINRSTSTVDKEPVRPSVNSVVRVTDRPKRDLKMNNKLLLLAVQDAQKSIIQTEQRSPKVEKSKLRNRESDLERRVSDSTYRRKDKSIKSRLQLRERDSEQEEDKSERNSPITSRRFNEFPEVNTDEFYEPTDAESRKKSVKERLGVRRSRRPVKDRLGVLQNQDTPEKEEPENEYEFNNDDFNIVINVNDTVEQRNVTLASSQGESDSKQLNRISIRVNDSEEEDTSEEEYDSSGNESNRISREKNSVKRSIRRDSGSVDGDEIVCVVNEEDKLPDPESDVEYIVEEIELEEGSDESEGEQAENMEPALHMSPKAEHKGAEKSDSTVSFHEPHFSIRLNNVRGQPNEISSEFIEQEETVIPPAKSFPLGPSQCKFWPNCQFKDNCIYEHPKCKFNPCTKTECVYKHNNPPVYKATSEKSSQKKVCKFYPKCTSMSCKFFHPSPCRFGVGCTSANCQNYHPGVTIGVQNMRAKGKTVIPKVNELKWVKK